MVLSSNLLLAVYTINVLFVVVIIFFFIIIIWIFLIASTWPASTRKSEPWLHRSKPLEITFSTSRLVALTYFFIKIVWMATNFYFMLWCHISIKIFGNLRKTRVRVVLLSVRVLRRSHSSIPNLSCAIWRTTPIPTLRRPLLASKYKFCVNFKPIFSFSPTRKMLSNRLSRQSMS